jgi:hypothetical protein
MFHPIALDVLGSYFVPFNLGCRASPVCHESFLELRVSAQVSGRAKRTSRTFITVYKHEELGDRQAPYADFGHGSLSSLRRSRRLNGLGVTAELSARSLFMPINIPMHHGELHAYPDRRQEIPSRAASGHAKPLTRKRPHSWREFQFGVP